ncbi:CpsD/CapB family tyrosine-protein kinase [uncultured Ruminococcus sp.]|uniref:CpsD/CapB family tyrosine-protein kinase n=1 Tax=uncultured Ruminococcus sp. TaxID=165186 RepID=UPI00265F6B9A|nr:CpsD/CapB family tyrosine-protein kinase [uncultured Ruminococcus sp.]
MPFSILETYKALRSSLNFLVSTSENKIVAVTSASPNEGKSVTVANLATAISETDKTVLLIDADMRKPVQHKNFQVSNKLGLSNVITDASLLDEALHQNVTGTLDLLTAGTIPPNPSELLASKQMAELLDKLKEKYDIILIDCAPVNVVSDVAGMANSIAGVVMVVHYGTTTYAEAEDAVKQLELANCNVLGFVLNEVVHKHSAGYYSNYKYKYKYKYDYQYRTEPSETESTETVAAEAEADAKHIEGEKQA